MSGLGAIVEATDGSGPLLKLAEARAQALLGAESPSFSLLCLLRRRTIRPSPPL